MKILFTLFGQGLERSDELHGDLTQEQRLRSLKRFRDGDVGFLLATDLASRGCVELSLSRSAAWSPKATRADPQSISRTVSTLRASKTSSTTRCPSRSRSTSIALAVLPVQAARVGTSWPVHLFLGTIAPLTHSPARSALTLVGESDRKLVKLAMKHAPPESIKQRTIPTDVVASVSKQLRALDGEVKAVVQEEREEKEVRNRAAVSERVCWAQDRLKLTTPHRYVQIRRGNMEIQKASNLLEHEAEIKSRPARTWFQTQSEKNAAKSASPFPPFRIASQLGALADSSELGLHRARQGRAQLEVPGEAEEARVRGGRGALVQAGPSHLLRCPRASS